MELAERRIWVVLVFGLYGCFLFIMLVNAALTHDGYVLTAGMLMCGFILTAEHHGRRLLILVGLLALVRVGQSEIDSADVLPWPHQVFLTSYILIVNLHIASVRSVSGRIWPRE